MRPILPCPTTTEVNQPITDWLIKGLGLMAHCKAIVDGSTKVLRKSAMVMAVAAGFIGSATTGWGQTAQSLPHSYNSGRAGLSSANGWSQTGIGSDYVDATTPIKFDTTADVATLLISAAPAQVSFYLKGNGFSAGAFTLSQSSDGTTFTTVSTYTTTITSSNVQFTQSLLSATRYIRWTYTTKSSGNVGLGTIAITAPAGPSITSNATTSADFTTTYGAASSNQTFTIAGTNLTANITATAGTGFQVSSDGGTYGSNATFTQTSGSASGTLYARLAANAAASGNYTSATVATLSSTSATNRTISTDSAGSAVSTRSLTITANNESKAFGNTVSSGSGKTAFTSSELQNSEGIGSVTITYAGGYSASDLAGNYTITPSAATGGNFTASNYGISYGNGTLTVTAVAPSAPTITGITSGDGQLSVAFTAPTSSGGASISDYAYSLDGGTYVSAGTTSSPLVISGLNNGVEYTVTLKAVNSAGDGSTSNGVSGTPAAPSSPTITVSGISGVLATTYGTVSGERSFTVSGAALTGDLTVTAPTGVEIATTSGGSFGGSVVLTASAGSVSSTTVYARLKATAAVTGSYNSVNFAVTGGGATQTNVTTISSGNTVTAKELTITGLTASPKMYDAGLTVSVTGNATYSGLANSDSFTPSDVVTWAFADKGVGNVKVLSRTGSFSAPSSDYTVTQPSLTANITTRELTVTGATAQTKAYSGNVTATITGAVLVGKQGADDVTIATSNGTFDTATVGTGKTVTAGLTLGGADASNYSLVQPSNLSADITQASQSISGVTAAVTKLVGDASYSVGGTASSGLALSYSSSVPSVASVDPSTGLVTVLSGGVTTITVSQAGNTNYSAASSATQTLTVNQSLAAWDVSATTMTAANCPTPTTAGNLTVTGFTRGSGITFTGSTFAREWGGYMGAITANATAAISSGTHLSLTIKSNAGYKVSLSKIPAAKIYSSTTGPKKGQWQFSIGGNYTNVGSEMAWTVNGVNDAPEVDLSAVTDLQNVDSSKTITLRLLGYSNSATTGTFALYDGTNSNAADISVQGIVTTNPTISTTGSLAALSTTYGTATATPGNFSVSGLSMADEVTLTPPSGYELATTSNFTSTVGTSGSPLVVGASGTIASTPVYIRLSATATVAGSPYSGNIVLSSSGANSVNVATTSSTVSAKALTIAGLTASNKDWDNTTDVTVTGTPTYSGLANGESFAVTGNVTWAFADAAVEVNKTLSRSGSYLAPSTNYSLTQPSLSSSVSAVVPVAPVIGSITAGNGQLSVAFTEPSSNGGAAVTNYEFSTDGGTSWTARSPANTSSPLVISGLSNGTTYDIQLRAVNSAGSGTPTSTTQAAPVAPTVPTITVSKASLAAKTTTYGTPSTSETFTVSGGTLSAGSLTVSAPTGFELSKNGVDYFGSLDFTISSGIVAESTVYARIAANAAVTGTYNSQNLTVSGGGADPVNVATATSGNGVSAKALTIAGIGIANKVYDRGLSASITGDPYYVGLANDETFTVTGTGAASFTTAAKANGKPVTVSDYTAPSTNYTLTQPSSLTANITAASLSLTGATVTTKPYDGSTVATITGAQLSGVISPDVVTLTGGTAGTFASANVGSSIAVSTSMGITGSDSGNYDFAAPTGLTGTIDMGTPVITFNALPSGKKVGDAAFSAGANSTLGNLTYTSSNPNVATVNVSTGSISLVAPGVTTITASVAASANWNASSASQALSVAAAGGTISTLFTESVGAASTTTPIGTYTGWSSSNLTFTGTGDTRNSSASSTYSGASAGGNVFLTGNGNVTFQIAGASTVGYTDLTLSFGAFKSTTASTMSELKLEYSTDGSSYQVVSIPAQASGTGTAVWRLISVSLPSGASGASNLRLRWTNTGSPQFRLDDLALTGTTPLVPAITTYGSLSALSTSYGTASDPSATTVAVTGGSLTGNITATAPSGFEVSSGGGYGATATFAQTSGFANGTLSVRLSASASAGTKSGNVVLSSPSATSVNVATVSSSISKLTPTLSGTLAATGITYGQTLADSTLSGVTASVSGDFTFTTPNTSPNVGTASQGVTFTPTDSTNYNTVSTTVDVTVSAASLPSLTFSGGVVTVSNGVSGFSYSYVGRDGTTYSTSSTAPTAPGLYKVTATSTDSNYSGSAENSYFIAGVIAGDDSLTKPADHSAISIRVLELLANDSRITSLGAASTSGLTITGVTAGAGNSVVLGTGADAGWIFFTPSSGASDTFTYAVSDGTNSANGTVTLTAEASLPPITLQLVKKGTAAFDGTTTRVSHDFIGVPGQTYQIEYSTDLTTWVAAGSVSTGATGSFSVNFSRAGDEAAAWNAHQFFRAKR